MTPPLICHSVVWAVTGRRAGFRALRVGDLNLPTASYSTQESGPSPHLRNAVNLAPVVENRRTGPTPLAA